MLMDIVGESMDELLHDNSSISDAPTEDIFDLSEDDSESFHDSVEGEVQE